VVLDLGAVGPSKPASAQPANPLYLTTSVHPSPNYRAMAVISALMIWLSS
jgi:hypothetical protein